MSRIQYEELSCPFCDKGRISCGYIPSALTERRSVTATFGSRGVKKVTKEIWLIQSGCSICGKSQEEVEKELKNKGII